MAQTLLVIVHGVGAQFARLELLLAEERDGDGTPSLTDFLVFGIPPIRDKLARHLEAETLPTDDPQVRVYIGGGTSSGTSQCS